MIVPSIIYRVILFSISAIILGFVQYGLTNPSVLDGFTKLSNGGKDARVEAMVSRPDKIKLSDI